MKILNRYILRECFLYFALSLLGFTSILLTVRMIRFANLIVNKGVEVSQIANVFIAIIPTFLEIAIPMSALLGVMMAFARLSGDSEIIVLRASGVSLFQLLAPLLLFGLIVTATAFYVSHVLKPWGFRQLSRAFFEIARSKSTSGLSEGVFNALGKITLYSESIDYGNGEIARVLIEDRRDNAVKKIIIARQGTIASDPSARTISIELRDGEIHEQTGNRYTLTHFTSNNLVFNSDDLMESDNQTNKEASADELSDDVIREQLTLLRAPIQDYPPPFFIGPPLPAEMIEHAKAKALEEQLQQKLRRKRTSKLEIELGRRFSMPLAALLLTLIAMPLGVVPPRTQKTYGIGLSIVLGIVVFLVYYGLLSFGFTMSEKHPGFVLVGLWLPNVVIAAVSALYIYKVGSEKWHSVAEALGDSLGRLRHFIWRRQPS